MSQLTIEVQGHGGKGGTYGGGGGGGGGFARGVYTVVPGSTISVGGDWYDTVSVMPFLYATRGQDGNNSYGVANPSAGGAGGTAGGGNLVNAFGGDGGAGFPNIYGGGGGGAGGILGNGFNGSNAPASSPNPSWTGPPGGNGGGGLAGQGGKGGISNYSGNEVYGAIYGAGGGGGGPAGNWGNSSEGYGSIGYCYISWGPCFTPPAPLVSGYTTICEGSSATLTARGYEPLIWFTDSLNTQPFDSGAAIQTSPLYRDTVLFVRSGGQCANHSPAQMLTVAALMLPPLVATVKPKEVCFGSDFTLCATGVNYVTWSNGSSYNPAIVSHTLNSSGNKTISISVEGSWYNNYCVAYDTVSVVLKEKPQFICVASKTNCCVGDTIGLTGSGPLISDCLWSNGAQGFSTSIVYGGAGGYSATVTDTSGCKVTFGAGLRNLTPQIVAFSSKSLSCIGDPVDVIALGASSYSWSNGHTGNVLTVYPDQTATYTVTGKSANCTNTATLVLFVSDCAGFTEEASDGFSLFPNPSEGLFTITGARTPVVIRDIRGETVFSAEALQSSTKINVRLIPGIYFVSSGPLTQKLIIVEH